MPYTIHTGSALDVLKTMPAESVQCCVTSPPYWGLRDYGVPGQLGLEPTPEEYVAKLVEIFREVRRVLRKDGTLWLNLGDSYNAFNGNRGPAAGVNKNHHEVMPTVPAGHGLMAKGLKPKDLVGIPWRVAFALQADGWYLRCDIIWSKPSCMPESVTDRPTRSHEYIFLLTKQERYFYDHEAIKEPYSESFLGDQRHETGSTTRNEKDGYAEAKAQNPKKLHRMFDKDLGTGRNKRSVWTVSTKPFAEAHFATYPEELVLDCIKAGTGQAGQCPECGKPWNRQTEKTRHFISGSGRSGKPPKGKNGVDFQGGGQTGDVRKGPIVETKTTGWAPVCDCGRYNAIPQTVLDPFNGAGTTGLVALKLGRSYQGIELNPAYVAMTEKRFREQLGELIPV